MLVLFSLFEIATHSAKDQNRGVVGTHTHVHQPQEHKEEQLFIFILFKSKVGCCCIQLNEVKE